MALMKGIYHSVGAPLIDIYFNIISDLIFYCKISPPFYFQYDMKFATRTRVATLI